MASGCARRPVDLCRCRFEPRAKPHTQPCLGSCVSVLKGTACKTAYPATPRHLYLSDQKYSGRLRKSKFTESGLCRLLFGVWSFAGKYLGSYTLFGKQQLTQSGCTATLFRKYWRRSLQTQTAIILNYTLFPRPAIRTQCLQGTYFPFDCPACYEERKKPIDDRSYEDGKV